MREEAELLDALVSPGSLTGQTGRQKSKQSSRFAVATMLPLVMVLLLLLLLVRARVGVALRDTLAADISYNKFTAVRKADQRESPKRKTKREKLAGSKGLHPSSPGRLRFRQARSRYRMRSRRILTRDTAAPRRDPAKSYSCGIALRFTTQICTWIYGRFVTPAKLLGEGSLRSLISSLAFARASEKRGEQCVCHSRFRKFTRAA